MADELEDYRMVIQLISKEHNAVIHELFETSTSAVKIISPFIGMDMARLLIESTSNDSTRSLTLITRFYREDFINGVSRIEALEMLNNAGADIYALKGLHTKLYLFGVETALLGSANFTSGGFKLNHELSLYVKNEDEVNPPLNAYYENLLKAITESGDFLLTSEKIAQEKDLVVSIQKSRKDKNITYRNESRFGADLPTSQNEVDEQQTDTIQSILTNISQSEYNETIWIKFEGSASGRRAMTDYYSPFVTDDFPQGATFFSDVKKPARVKNGDYVILAVYCDADLPYIVGRGKSVGYIETNVATSEMKAENEWMVDYPHFYKFIEFEYIDAPISKCIPLREVLRDLGSNMYVSTAGKSITLEDLRKRHRQQAHVRLTACAKNYIDGLIDDLVEKYGAIRLETAPESKPVQSQRDKITYDMIEVAYEVAKGVYEGKYKFDQGRNAISARSGMSIGSSGDFIRNFRAMMEGDEYQRTLNNEATKYYLESIRNDFGIERLKTALLACQKHVDYYSTLGHGKLRGVEQIIAEYSKGISV
jgi:HKD family nuclease